MKKVFDTGRCEWTETKKECAMTSENNESSVPISNWALATGTRPGERNVYQAEPKTTVQPSEPKARS